MRLSALKLLLSGIDTKTQIAPGPTELQFGTVSAGYFGELTSSELFGSAQLGSLVGLTAGQPVNEGTDWMKFAHKGKILYYPKKSLYGALSWNDLYAAGLVYGTDDNGTTTRTPGVNQATVVQKNGSYFLVRLMQGSVGTVYTSYDGPNTTGSEWNDLMYRVSSYTPASQTGGTWTPLSNADLGFGSAWGAYVWIRDENSPNVGVIRGGVRIDYVETRASDSNTNQNGWRPVLEYLGSAMPTRKVITQSYDTSFMGYISTIESTTADYLERPVQLKYTSPFVVNPTIEAPSISVDISSTGPVVTVPGDYTKRSVSLSYTADYLIKPATTQTSASDFVSANSVPTAMMSGDFMIKGINLSYSSDYMIKPGGLNTSTNEALSRLSAISFTVTEDQ